MFRLIKEALATPPAPVPLTAPAQRAPSPLRSSLTAEQAARRASASSHGTSAPRSGTSRSGAPARDPETLKKEEIAALKATDEDMKVGELLEKLRFKKGINDLEETLLILAKLHSQLANHVPAAQGLFRISSGFSIISQTLTSLSPLAKKDGTPADGQGSAVAEDEPGDSGPSRARTDTQNPPVTDSAVAHEDPRASSGQPKDSDSASDRSLVFVNSDGKDAKEDEELPSGGTPDMDATPRPPSGPFESQDISRGDGDGALSVPMEPKYEALKFCFYILDAALANDFNRRWFEQNMGWDSLLPTIRSITEDTSFDDGFLPDLDLLGILFSTAFGADPTLLTAFNRYLPKTDVSETVPSWPHPLPISSTLNLAHPTLLPTIFSLLPLPYLVDESKTRGTSKVKVDGFMTSSQVLLEHLVWRIMLVVLQSSWTNLFQTQLQVPTMIEGVLDRLYPPVKASGPSWTVSNPSQVDVEPPFDAGAWGTPQPAGTPKEGLLTPGEQTSASASSGSRYASSSKLDPEQMLAPGTPHADFDFREKAEQPLRAILLRILKRSVEAGIPPQYSHKLFRLAKLEHGARPSPEPSETGPPRSDESSPGKLAAKRARPIRAPSLHLVLDTNLQARAVPAPTKMQLDGDVLDVIRHGMSRRWPDMFCFSPQLGGSQGGISGSIHTAAFPKSLTFSTWMYIESLSQPVTLVHLFDSERTLLRIRILPSSEVALLDQDGVERCFESPVPHRRWVKLDVGLPNKAHRDVKLAINGKRVGGVRCAYPRPAEKADVRFTVGKDGRAVPDVDGMDFSIFERSTFFLGPCMLMGDYLPDDLALLVYHLGPRYQSNLQEPLGRFLSYEAATALNIYLSAMAVSKDKTRPVLPTNSYLIKGIKEGKLVPEESIIFSFAGRNCYRSQLRRRASVSSGVRTELRVHNAAAPSPIKAGDVPNGHATVSGDVFSIRPVCLDEAMSIIGGPVVALRLVELSTTSKELLESITILWEAVRESWAASEDMERMRGYDLLAGLLKLKMRRLVDVHVAKAIFGTLGIDFERPERATVHNSTAYRTLTRFDLWSTAPFEVLSLYFEQYKLLFKSRHRRFNVLRYFKKAGLIRKMLFALRAELFDSEVVPLAVDTLQLALKESWSADDAIKPLFAYLVASLCNTTPTSTSSVFSPIHQLPSTAQTVAGSVLGKLPAIVEDPARMSKLTAILPLHRIIIIFLTCNQSDFVALPCLQLARICLGSASGSHFEKKFEMEGGFTVLAQALSRSWNPEIQEAAFVTLLGSDPNAENLGCAPLLSSVLATIERLLQTATEEAESATSPRSGMMRTRSAMSSSYSSLPAMMLAMPTPVSDDETLSGLLNKVVDLYQSSAPFRKAFDHRRLEALVPGIADFLSMSAGLERLQSAREALERLMELWHENGRLPEMLRTQLSALLEQIRVTAVSPRTSGNPLPFSPSSTSLSSSMFLPSSPSRLSTPPSRPPRRTTTLERRTSARAKAMFEKRIPLRRQLTGEANVQERRVKLLAWKDSIVTAEAARFIKTTVEIKEFWSRVSRRDWPKQFAVVDSEASLWPTTSEEPHWRLDGTEGSMRKRLKLERALVNSVDKASSFYPKSHRNPIPRQDELASAVSRFGSSPDEDPFALAMGEAAGQSRRTSTLGQINEGEVHEAPAIPTTQTEEPQPIDSDEEDALDDMATEEVDKHRRIAQTLQSGDSVDEAFNVSRVVGVDSAPGLLIIGKRNLYLIDGLVQMDNGEIISAQDATKDLFSIPSGTLAELDASELQSHRWSYADIVENHKRSFLFRDVAIEFAFSDKLNFLCVFRSKKERQAVLQRISAKVDPSTLKRSAIGSFVLESVAKAIDKASLELDAVTSRWQRREISNFAYLQALNQFANRTPNDVTQYPVFPWVLSDYVSETLDLQSVKTFRDLTLPMGALTPARREAATERYQQTQLAGEKPFQFGTHFSSSMIVCSFNIRISPFTEMFLTLQGGQFDADRMFGSISQAWDSASHDNRGDVRELIPEFYYSPIFLKNMNRLDFGRKQNSEDIVNDVALPPWAHGDPLLFIHRHREALESEYVSRHLPDWIDLTFGNKQHDPASFTCFHPLSYKDAIDLDAISDEAEKAASVGIIHNFGQTPYKIFNQPHPPRYMSGRPTLPMDQRFGVDEHWILLLKNIKPIVESSVPLISIYEAASSDLGPQALPFGRIPFGQLASSTLRYGFFDQSLRAYHGMNKLIWRSESTSVDNAVFVTPTLLATSAPTGIVTIWKLVHNNLPYLNEGSRLVVDTLLRGHGRKVNCLTASQDWSVLVSCSDDGSAIVWDTNRMRFLRKLKVWPEEPVLAADILPSDGHIALLCASNVHVFTLNGEHIVSAPATATSLETFRLPAPPTASEEPRFTGGISFHNKDFAREGPLFAVGTGKDIALLRMTPGSTAAGPWLLKELKRLSGPERSGNVLAVKFIGETLCATFEGDPRDAHPRNSLHQWSLPEGGARLIPEHTVSSCMYCAKSFGILEPRRSCGGCGGVFCSQDAIHVEGFTMRYCPWCRTQLAVGMAAIGPASRRSSLAGVGSRRGSLA